MVRGQVAEGEQISRSKGETLLPRCEFMAVNGGGGLRRWPRRYRRSHARQYLVSHVDWPQHRSNNDVRLDVSPASSSSSSSSSPTWRASRSRDRCRLWRRGEQCAFLPRAFPPRDCSRISRFAGGAQSKKMRAMKMRTREGERSYCRKIHSEEKNDVRMSPCPF